MDAHGVRLGARIKNVLGRTLIALFASVVIVSCGIDPDDVELSFSALMQADDVTVLIGGQERERLALVLPYDGYVDLTMDIEIVHEASGAVLDTGRFRTSCHEELSAGDGLEREGVSLCVLPQGQLAFGSNSCRYRDGYSVGDGFCTTCSLGQESQDRRCDLTLALDEPERFHLRFGPKGSVPVGAACEWPAPGVDSHNPCEAGALCNDGECQRLCEEEDSQGCAGLSGTACLPVGALQLLGYQVGALHGTCREPDGSAWPPCLPWEDGVCEEEERCAKVWAVRNPDLLVNTCVPQGRLGEGQGCEVSQEIGVPHDECEKGHLCADGLCRPLCRIDDPTSCAPYAERVGERVQCKAIQDALPAFMGVCQTMRHEELSIAIDTAVLEDDDADE